MLRNPSQQLCSSSRPTDRAPAAVVVSASCHRPLCGAYRLVKPSLRPKMTELVGLKPEIMEKRSILAAASPQHGALDYVKDAIRSPLVKALLLAQVLSLLLCVMGTSSGILAKRGVNMPATQSVLNYLLLAVTCGGHHLATKGRRLSNPWWVYLLLAVLDVEANFLVTSAYQYTSVTSVTLLDCFTIPAVMALSALALRAAYTPRHLAGAALCVGGLAVLVATDGGSDTGGPNPLLGDVLVLMGASLYAVSNVAQERVLLGATPVSELLGALGAFGVLVGGAQAAVLEHEAWAAADWSRPSAVALPLAAFGLSLYAFYLIVPLVLRWSGATVLNLSLLTSDLWAGAARVVFFGGFGGTAGWFLLALALEAVGLVVYAVAGQTHPHPDGKGRGEEGCGGGGSGVGMEAGAGEGRGEEGQEEEERRGLLSAVGEDEERGRGLGVGVVGGRGQGRESFELDAWGRGGRGQRGEAAVEEGLGGRGAAEGGGDGGVARGDAHMGRGNDARA